MTTPSQPRPGTDETPTPPPGCPAHRPAGGARRLYGPEAEHDLGGLYEELRAEYGAVAPVLLHQDVPAWVVLGHSENLHMVRTPSHFTRDSRYWSAIQDGTAGPTHPLAPVFTWQPMCTFAEGAEHKRLRGAVTSAIGGIDGRGVRRCIARSSQELVNAVCQIGTAELVGQFAEHLPMMVLCEILGMPEEYSERMVGAARDMIKGTETAIASNEYVMQALTRLTLRRRARPAEDFASALIAHESRLTDDEVAQHLRLVLIAAYEATANLIANVLRMVMTDPRFRARLNGGQMTVPEAVEQTLWDEPPFSAMVPYVAKQDTELGGQRIRAGDALLLGIAPGNADPVVRPVPGAHMQGNRAHLAFSGGPHECPGQDIGRAITEGGVDALLTRLPDVQLAVDESELEWTSSVLSRHLVTLPVAFTPTPLQDVARAPVAGNAVLRDDEEWHVGDPAGERVPAVAGVAAAAAPGAAAPTGAMAPTPAGTGVAAPFAGGVPEPAAPAHAPGPLRRFLRWWHRL
ncbi:cytochrome P450 [Streptomyces sp. NPDC050560]|uniref:cytochrome P450 n=1 Tax=Streptomyces sp. NPDC050560 TaxID=3365630 RepID=UPI0037A7BA3B